MKAFITFDQAIFTTVERKLEFGGRSYSPDRGKAFFDGILCHTLPSRNANGRGFAPKTLARSFSTARNQLVDFDHRLAFYSSDATKTEDRVCGGIVDVEFPDVETALASFAKGTPVPLRALLVAYRKAKGVDKMIDDIADEVANWRTSIEIEYAVRTAALFHDGKFIPVDKASKELRAGGTPNSVDDFEGKTLTFCPGGEDGEMLITGAAFTRWPADTKAALSQMAACAQPKKVLMLNAGWHSADDWRQAVATALPPVEGEPAKPAQVKSSMVCGDTMPAGADKHTHQMLQDMSVAGGDHSHYARVVSVAPVSGGGVSIEGVTSPKAEWDRNGNFVSEHSHMFKLGDMVRSDMAAVVRLEDPNMKGVIKHLRELATALATSNPEQAKESAAQADRLEKTLTTEGVEEVVAGRIKSGDLVAKATHEAAVAEAKKLGEKTVRDELATKEQAEKDRVAALATRTKALSDAKINLKFALTPERTIEQEVAAIPAGAEGEKRFQDRFAEWQHIAKTTGQMVATAAAPAEPPPVPLAPASIAGAAMKKVRGLV